MLELDECDQLLVANPFADDNSSAALWNSDLGDAFVTLTSSEHHPLRSRSVSPTRPDDTPTIPSVVVVGSGDEARSLLSLDAQADTEGNQTGTSEGDVPQSGSDEIIHSVGPNDSLAGVALRYGVSIAALRRANQLWPSDPIHLRTELLIPHGDMLRIRHKHKRAHNASTKAAVRSAVESMPDLPPDLVAPSFLSARNMILSMLPGRISLESLSSKATASEDHELDDFRAAAACETPFAQEGLELSVLGAPQARYKRPSIPLSWQIPTSPTNSQHILPSGDLRSQSTSSLPAVSIQPFTSLPVRTSQLEPEPAMELPVRRSQLNRRSLWTDGVRRRHGVPFG